MSIELASNDETEEFVNHYSTPTHLHDKNHIIILLVTLLLSKHVRYVVVIVSHK